MVRIAADLVSMLEQLKKAVSQQLLSEKKERLFVRSINQTYQITLFKQQLKKS